MSSIKERMRYVYSQRGKNKAIPWGSEEELKIFITYRISLRAIRRLYQLKKKLGFRTYEAVIMHLMNLAEREGLISVATPEKLTRDTRPVVITGEPGSGKTLFAKSTLNAWGKEVSIFLIDVADEYPMLSRLNLGEVFGLNWRAKGLRHRFVPNPNVEISKAEVSTIFGHLNVVKQEGVLKNWIVIVEEAHRFQEDKNFNALVVEARKFTKKLMLITTDWRPWDGKAIIYKPPALDTLLQKAKG